MSVNIFLASLKPNIMSLIRRRNGDLIPSLRGSISDLFDADRFFEEPFFRFPFTNGRRFLKVPATNIRDTDEEFIVELAAPGMKKSDFQVDIDNNVLEIKVDKEDFREEKEKEYSRKEYDYTSFCRSFELPESVNADKIKAEYQEGILKVHLPKVPEAKRKPVKEIKIA